MYRLKLSIMYFLLFCGCAFSQEIITAEKEKITSLKLGSSELELSYECNEEGFYSPNGPMIDEKGNMLLYPEAGNGAYDHLIQIDHSGTVSKRELFPIMKEWRGATSLLFVSQQGYVQLNNVCIVLSEAGYGSAFYPHAVWTTINTDLDGWWIRTSSGNSYSLFLNTTACTGMIVSGFANPVSKELPLEYAVEMNNLIQLEMKGTL